MSGAFRSSIVLELVLVLDFSVATPNYDKSGLYPNPGPAFQRYIICSCESGAGCSEPFHSRVSR
jgi:hypothetical protein